MAQYDINLREYWRILKKRRLIVIITSVLLMVFSTLFSILQAPTPLYTSVCSIKFEKETTLEGLYAKSLSWSGGDDIATQLSIIKGYSVLSEVAKNLGLIPRQAAIESPRTIAVVENLKSKIRVERESFTNILNIMVTDPDPVLAQRMGNELVATYKRVHAEQQGKRTIDAINYISDQLNKVRLNLKSAEEEFNRFSQVNQLISIDLQSENLLLREKEIRDRLRKLNEDQSELRGLLSRVENFLRNPSSSDTNFYSSNADSQYQTANNSLVELLLKRDTLLENFTAQHPEVIAIGYKIIENARKMVMLLKLQIDNIERKKIDLAKEQEGLERKTNHLMEKKLEYDRLKREVDSFRDMTALLEKKNQEALIRKAEKPEEVVIVKPALLPSSPINPPKYMATGVMGLMIGIVLGLVLAFIIETFDTSLGAIEDVEETLGAKVLGVIPLTDVKEIMSKIKDRYPKEMDENALKTITNLVSHFAPKTMIAESFRALRTNIHFREGEDKVKTIAVTSTSPQEGKTLVSVNLAVSLAQAGLKTLLVGSDLRKPMLAKIFGLEKTPGLTDIILGTYPWRDTIKTVTDIIMGKITMDEVMMTPGMDNLHIITSGNIPPNPAELIESKRLMEFIDEAKKEYDIIIFDSTPVLSTADAAILGTKVDGVLIVYRVGTVSRGLLKRTSTQLEQVNCNIIGVILNGMKPDVSPDFQDYKYYKYYSNYGEEEKKKDNKGRIWPFSLFKGKGQGRDFQKGDSLPSFRTRSVKGKQKSGSHLFLKAFLIVVALVLLILGIFWQNGIYDPGKIMRLIKSPVKEKPSGAKAPSPVMKTKGVEKIAPVGKPENIRETSAGQNKPVMGDKTLSAPKEYSYKTGSFPYSLYMGSFSTGDRAEKAISQYRQKGLTPFWVKIHLKDKGDWFRIYAGYFKEAYEAQKYIQEKGSPEMEVKKTAYANLIGVYENSEDLDSRIRSLRESGYSPYIINDQDGKSVLFVGAFFTKSGSEQMKIRLQTDEIANQVVER